MSKTNEQLLASYKKANKERRVKIVAASKFKTEAGYLKSLMTATIAKKNVKPLTVTKGGKNVIIHNVHILDASGSMQSKLPAAVQGINEDIANMKKMGGKITQTLIDFSSSGDVNEHFFLKDINKVDALEKILPRNYTALYQTIGETLEKLCLKVDKKDKVLVKIFTDGGENGSVGKYRQAPTLKSLITSCEKRGMTITFVGTEQDVKNIIQLLSIDESNTLVHDNTAQGVADSFGQTVIATSTYFSNVAAGKSVTRGFYTKKKGIL